MGGTGGVFRRASDIDKLKEMYADVSRQTQSLAYESGVSDRLNELLAQYNDRDTDKIRDYLEEIEETLRDQIEGAIKLKFSGSVAKHTYVDGLSDVDCLILLKDPTLETSTPRAVLDYFAGILIEALRESAQISVGDLAVTIKYSDGTEIQLLPAIIKGPGFMISSSRGEEWSNIIRPDKFAHALTNVNQRCGGKVVPTIKLVKAAINRLPKEYQLTGYHVESLGIEAFKRYSGVMTTKAMLEYSFDKLKDLVLRPIKDKTGQSLHVDDYLGPRNNRLRQAIASELDSISRRMKAANTAELPQGWLEEIGD